MDEPTYRILSLGRTVIQCTTWLLLSSYDCGFIVAHAHWVRFGSSTVVSDAVAAPAQVSYSRIAVQLAVAVKSTVHCRNWPKAAVPISPQRRRNLKGKRT